MCQVSVKQPADQQLQLLLIVFNLLLKLFGGTLSATAGPFSGRGRYRDTAALLLQAVGSMLVADVTALQVTEQLPEMLTLRCVLVGI